jgi:hypothetical protein
VSAAERQLLFGAVPGEMSSSVTTTAESRVVRPGTKTLYPTLDAAGPGLCTFFAVVAFWLWAGALGGIDPRQINDLGLVSVLPWQAIASLFLLTGSFCLLLHCRPFNVLVGVLHVVLLVLMLYGMTTFIEDVPRFAVSLRHAGPADYIVQHGGLDGGVDAYFNWPGFFALAALFTKVTGLGSAIQLAGGAAIYFNLLYVAAVGMLLRSATPDRRVIWLGTWIFAVSNWVGQDYFSPQALSYFLHLMVLAILLSWFRHERYRSADGDAADAALLPSATVAERVGFLAIAILLYAALVPTHQFAPLVTLFGVLALVLARRTTARGLYVLFAVLLLGWVTFAASDYLSGDLGRITSDVANVFGDPTADASEHLSGSADHLFVLRIRLVLTAGLWGLALLGAMRRLGRGHRDVTFAVLAVAPLPLLLLQGIGGEVLLRVYLFSLPFVAFFVAALFFPSLTSRTTWVTTTATTLVCLSLLGCFLFARYGDEKINQFSEPELQVIDRLYAVAPEGALLVTGSVNVPWQSQRFTDYRYLTLSEVEDDEGRVLPTLATVTTAVLREPPGCAFVLMSRSQRTYADLLGIWPRGTLTRLEGQIINSPRYEQVFASDDAAIYRLRPRSTTQPQPTRCEATSP